jgi:hypothetical protein
MAKVTRRTLLRGAAVSLALPWLDIMRPASCLAASLEPSRRIGFMYIPNGIITQHWFPASLDDDFLAPQSLRPLEPIRDDVVVINGLNRTYLSGEPHSQCGSCWMTSARPDENAEGNVAINTTLDQIIARKVGEQTPFPSLELSCNSFVDNMEPKMFDAISWYGPGHDAKSMNDPVAVFERLFGRSANFNRSVLDTILDDARNLRNDLGIDDRRKLDEYLQSVRAIEKRLDKQEASRKQLAGISSPVPDRQPVNRGEYIRLMGDLMVMAFKTDQTRVASLMVGPERWETPQMYDSVFDRPVNHHQMTHDDQFDELVAKIDRFHVEQFVYLVEQLRNTPEGDGCLLDNTFFVLGSGLGDGNSHSYHNLPMVIAGRGGGEVDTGRRVDCPEGTPLANLWLSLARKMGIEMNEFADSTAALREYVA